MKQIFKLWPIVVVLSLVLTFIYIPYIVKIHNIDCHTQLGQCDGSYFDKLEQFEGSNLKTAKYNLKKILGNEKLISEFVINFQPFDTIKIDVLQRKARYGVTTTQKNNFSLIDKDYITISQSASTDLPYLIVDDNLPEIGSVLDNKRIFALNLLSDVYSGFQVKEAKIEKDTLLIDLPGTLRVIFPVDGDREVLIGSLMLITDEIKNGKYSRKYDLREKINTVDLRYKNPILKNIL